MILKKINYADRQLCWAGAFRPDCQEEANVTVQTIVETCELNDIVVFTDGSCLGNPVPCRSRAYIFIPNQTEPIRLKRLVTNSGSILLGELVAILMALEFAQIEYRKRQFHSISIFYDIQSAVGMLTLGWSISSHKKTAEDIRRLIPDLEKSRLEVSIKWTPGHADIRGNCIADELANEAVEEAK